MKFYSYSKRALIALLFACGSFTFSIPSAYSEDRGLEIAKAVYDRPDGNSSVVKVFMILQSANGRERQRQFYSYHKDYGDHEEKVLVRFVMPNDVKDTAMLTFNHPMEESDQWLYLPESDLSRRIHGDRKGGRFVNSDLFFEDLRDRHYSKDRHTFLGQEEIDGVLCDKIESIPVSSDNSSYSKRIAWVHPETQLAVRIDFYRDSSTDPIKRMQARKIDKVQGYWTIIDSEVINYEMDHKTLMHVDKITYDVDLPDFLFEEAIFGNPDAEIKYRD